jgi:hypothetical protein
VAVPEADLPLRLPDTDEFRPSGTPESPLANITDWVNTTDPATGGQGGPGVSGRPAVFWGGLFGGALFAPRPARDGAASSRVPGSLCATRRPSRFLPPRPTDRRPPHPPARPNRPAGRPARRETSTMPQWAGSCWYYLRFIDPTNPGAPVDPAKERYWMPVDLYVGGAEHAVLHLLYARFWHKVGAPRRGRWPCFEGEGQPGHGARGPRSAAVGLRAAGRRPPVAASLRPKPDPHPSTPLDPAPSRPAQPASKRPAQIGAGPSHPPPQTDL